MSWPTRSLSTAIAAFAATAVVSPGLAQPAPLCPSVLMVDTDSWRRAPERVNRVAELLDGAAAEARWVQLVPTIHVTLTPDLRIERFGLRTRHTASWSDLDNFTPLANPAGFRRAIADSVGAAIAQAVRRGLNVAILPHLDAAGPVQEWRNLFDFHPEANHDGGSYRSLLLDPIAQAIEREANTDTQIDFALSGEMGRSLFTHPDAYRDLLESYRRRFAASARTRNVRLGVALNWSTVAGERTPAETDPAALAAAFGACDVVGFSCYAPVSVPPTAADFATAMTRSVAEVETYGVKLGATPLVIAEVGIGGGVAQKAGPPGEPRVGPTVADVAAQPWAGRGVSDRNPWDDPALDQLRRGYYAALCEHLAGGAAAQRVDRAFLWSEGPWDPQGVTDVSRPDKRIAERIAAHNATVGLANAASDAARSNAAGTAKPAAPPEPAAR